MNREEFIARLLLVGFHLDNQLRGRNSLLDGFVGLYRPGSDWSSKIQVFISYSDAFEMKDIDIASNAEPWLSTHRRYDTAMEEIKALLS